MSRSELVKGQVHGGEFPVPGPILSQMREQSLSWYLGDPFALVCIVTRSESHDITR